MSFLAHIECDGSAVMVYERGEYAADASVTDMAIAGT